MVFQTRMMEHKREQHTSKGMRPAEKKSRTGTLSVSVPYQIMRGLPEVKLLYCL